MKGATEICIARSEKERKKNNIKRKELGQMVHRSASCIPAYEAHSIKWGPLFFAMKTFQIQSDSVLKNVWRNHFESQRRGLHFSIFFPRVVDTCTDPPPLLLLCVCRLLSALDTSIPCRHCCFKLPLLFCFLFSFFAFQLKIHNQLLLRSQRSCSRIADNFFGFIYYNVRR